NTIVADVTVLSLMTQSHQSETADAALDAARATKTRRYGKLCDDRDVKLVTFAATANGHLSKELATCANMVADRLYRDRRTYRDEISAAIAHGSAVARLAAEERCGIRPQTIALDQVRLLERFRIAPLQN